jgi:hypothetical protein
MMSFALTTEQVRNRSKTVTRRLGWLNLKPGTLLQPVLKAQGIPKGGRVQKIGGPIRVVSVRREPLSAITVEDVRREGFPEMSDAQFCEMFVEANGLATYPQVTRIEFEYVDQFPTSPQKERQ